VEQSSLDRPEQRNCWTEARFLGNRDLGLLKKSD
jgi:hypothetical protein